MRPLQAGRRMKKTGHYQAIVKGPPCPTNITTPGQNQHVPQANNKPAPSTETCNQNPDNQHDEYDDDEDIFANLCIPPMQTRPKDVANICHKQTSEEKELWTLSHENKSCWCYLGGISSSFQESQTEEAFPQHVAV